MKKLTTLFVGLVALTLLAGMDGDQPDWSMVVDIPDEILNFHVRYTIDKLDGGDITYSDLFGILVLNAPQTYASIYDLSGLEHCANLVGLDVSASWAPLYPAGQISDLTPIANLTNMRELDLYGNQIDDLALLANFTNLRILGVGWNGVSDLSPLAGLTRLLEFGASRNQLTDLAPLAGWQSIKVLSLWDNWISDISPLVQNSGIGSGDYIDLHGNPLSAEACNIHIPALEARGVEVDHDCP